jgi:hypothetical protein
MAKTKKTKKDLQEDVKELNLAVGSMYVEIQKLNQFMVGLENLIMYYAEMTGNKKEFEDFLQNKLEESKVDNEKNSGGK